MATRLYVVIPTHGRASLLGRTLASLAECTLPASYVETVVVENGPKEGAEAICQQADARLKVRYLYVEKANKSHALNEACATLPDDALVVFFDDDVRLESGVLMAYASASGGVARGYFYGGTMDVDYEREPSMWLLPYLPASAKGWRLEDEADLQKARFLGANWSCFAGDLRAVGGFDVRRGPGTTSVGQEYDMQVRLLESGATPVYVPEALVWHYVPEHRCSPEWLLDRVQRIGVSLGRKERREHGWRWALARTHLRRWAKRMLHARKLQSTDPAERFDAAYQHTRQRSILKGYLRG